MLCLKDNRYFSEKFKDEMSYMLTHTHTDN